MSSLLNHLFLRHVLRKQSDGGGEEEEVSDVRAESTLSPYLSPKLTASATTSESTSTSSASTSILSHLLDLSWDLLLGFAKNSNEFTS